MVQEQQVLGHMVYDQLVEANILIKHTVMTLRGTKAKSKDIDIHYSRYCCNETPPSTERILDIYYLH